VNNRDVARVLDRLATMLEMDGANSFRVRAYREAGRVLTAQAESVETLAATEGALESLRGIGKDLAQKIRDLATTGTTSLYEEMARKYPVEVVDFTELQGLGPKRVKTLFDALGVRTRADLGRAAEDGKLRDLPGFGETVEKNVLRALATARAFEGRMLLAGAWPLAESIAQRMRGIPGVEQVEVAGSFRRRRETVGDLDLLVTGGRPEAVMKALTGHPEVLEVLGEGETKSSVRLKNGLQVDLRLVPRASYGAALLYFTGSKEHNIELRRIAIDKGWSLNEYGLTHGDKTIAGRTEEEVYRALGLEWIPPELREARGEIERAREGALPKLVEEADLKGDLHMHTDRTDGRDSLVDMVRAAHDRGYAYCAITDHSKALTMIGGFDEARVRRSVAEIAAVRKQVPGIEVLHGLEVDILADGRLDLADDALALLDWVVISLHTRLDQPAALVTERALKALAHPAVRVMGHPTGRLMGTREPAALDLERVFDLAAERGVAMEINAQPDRLDLTDVHARQAHERGVQIVIDTDAHSVGQLENIRYGVFVARRAGLTREDVLNTRPYERFRVKSGGRPKPPAVTRAASQAGRASHAPGEPAGASSETTKAARASARLLRPSARPTAGAASRRKRTTRAAGAKKPGAGRSSPARKK